jgi:hypothetical protein
MAGRKRRDPSSRAGLTEDETRAAARVVVDCLKHGNCRKRTIAAATIASAAAVRTI